MTDREKLIKLLDDVIYNSLPKHNKGEKVVEDIADYLIENGVVISFNECSGISDKSSTTNSVEVIRCEQCTFWDRKHISCEGYAKCITGENGIRLRRKNDYCSVAQSLSNNE